MYAICRVEKVKAAAVGAMQYHNDRAEGAHGNPDIDPARRGENVELFPHGDYREEIGARIERFRTSSRKVRKDAVVLVEGIATASPEFFEGKTREQVGEFFADVYDFCAREFGAQNLVHFTIHMDETTPHAHFGFVPIRDGALSWKKFFDGKRALSAFQDRFFESVGRRWGLERGERSEESGRTHRDMQRMKRDSSREIRALQGETRKARDEAECARRRAQEAAREMLVLDAQRSERRAELGTLDAEVEGKRSQAADLSREIREKTAAVEDAKAELAEVFSQSEAAKQDAADATEEAVRLTREADEACQRRDEARLELERARADVDVARGELAQVRADRDAAAAQRDAVREQLEAMRRERRTLTEELASLRERVRTFVDAARAFVGALYERGLGAALADLLAPASDNPLVGDMLGRAYDDVAQGHVSADRLDDALEAEGYGVLDGEAQLIDDDAEWLASRVGRGGDAR